MKCPICDHGEVRPGSVSVTLDREGTTVVFRNVPARICGNCGEEFVDEATTASLLRQAEAAAKAGVEVEVRGFAA